MGKGMKGSALVAGTVVLENNYPTIFIGNGFARES